MWPAFTRVIRAVSSARHMIMPPSRALARQYGVALMTVQTALRRLRDEGRVYSTGRGYFVRDPDQAPSADGPDGVARRLDALEAEVRELRARMETLESDR